MKSSLSAFDLFSSNDINGATSAQNARMTGAFTPVALAADTTVNSLNINGNGGTWNMTNKLTVLSGMILRNGTNAAIDISSGTLTAGTDSAPIDLHFFTAQQNMSTSGSSMIADNTASGVVTLVKSHGNQLTHGGAASTSSGGTYVVDGTLATGNVVGRAYLGTGKVTVNGTSSLSLGSYGATSNSTGADFTAINGGQITLANVNHGGNGDTFNIGANSIIQGGSSASNGLASLSRGTNITLAADAIIQHQNQMTAALNLATGTIQNLGTAANLYYGVSTFNQNNTGGELTIGTGTAFKGLAVINNIFWDIGTIKVASGTSDVSIKTNLANTAAPFLFTFGSGTAGGPIVSLADAGTLNINILGRLRVNDVAATFGDTSANKTVRFVVTAGSTLDFTAAATGMGSGIGIASALVENGGVLAAATSTDALNGAVTVASGGRFDAALAGGVTGSGQITFEAGSILNITNATGFSGSQAIAAAVNAGTIVRLNASAQPGTTAVTLDSFLGSKSPIYQLNGDIDVPEPSLQTTTLTLNKNGSGGGGIMTNGFASTSYFRKIEHERSSPDRRQPYWFRRHHQRRRLPDHRPRRQWRRQLPRLDPG